MESSHVDAQTTFALLRRGFAAPVAAAQNERGGGGKKQKGKGKGKGQQGKQQRVPVNISSIDDALFGDLARIQSSFKTNRKWTEVQDLKPALDGQKIWIRARLHHSRDKGKRTFLTLRHGVYTVQGMCSVEDVPRPLVKFSARIPKESIVDVYATVTVPPNPVASTTQGNVELQVKKIYVISCAASELPFQIVDAGRLGSEPDEFAEQEETKHTQDDEKDAFVKVHTDSRLNYRWLDARTAAKAGIFRISSGVGQFYREFLLKEGFIEIHTPKIIPGVSEGGAEVFRLKYFGGNACLAQSPQLYKQMAISSDFGKVFEIAPVFRAENSNTPRHLTEFVGMDMEMEIKEHYDEVLDVVARLFVFMFNKLNEHFSAEIEAVQSQYPFEPLVYKTHTPVLRFSKCVEMLRSFAETMRAEGSSENDIVKAGGVVDPHKDFSPANEKRLGKLVKEEFGQDFYIVDKYPIAARPFYSMPCLDNPASVNAYDAFMRGEEIASGAQRIHDADLLTERAIDCDIPMDGIKKYIDSFRHGACPHGGLGVGLERVVMLFLGLKNVKQASLFPRTPRRCEP